MELEFIKPDYRYWEFIRNLRNDPRVKSGFISQNDISVEDHKKYMEKYYRSFRVVLEGGEPVGYYRIIDLDISFCVHPDHQGKGIGKAILNYIKEKWQLHIDYGGPYGKVKTDNIASQKAFEKAGWTKKYVVYEYDPKINKAQPV